MELPSWVSRPWSKTKLVEDGQELTVYGEETQEEVSNDPTIVDIAERRTTQRHLRALQLHGLTGLRLVLLEVFLLVLLAVVGVANHWYSESFAQYFLSISVPSSVGAWMYIVRQVFRSRPQ